MNMRKNRLRHLPTALLIAIFVLLILPACGRHHPRAFERHGEDGWIGVYVQDLDGELRDYLGVDTRHGVMINSVVQGSPADDAGLREEDVIVRFDGRRIRESSDLVRSVRRKSPGDRVEVQVIRDGRERELHLRIGERERKFARAPRPSEPEADPKPFAYSFSDNRRAWLGVRMAELNEDLAGYFDVERNEGVLILSVEEDSPAASAGLRGGDVILEIDGQRVNDTSELAKLIGAKHEGDEIEVSFKRRGRARTRTIELGQAPQRFNFDFNVNPDALQEWKDKSGTRWDSRAFRDRMRDLRDRIRTQVRDNIRHDVRKIRHRIHLNDLHLELPHLEDQIHIEVNDEIQREIDQHLGVEREHLENELETIKIKLKEVLPDDSI